MKHVPMHLPLTFTLITFSKSYWYVLFSLEGKGGMDSKLSLKPIVHLHNNNTTSPANAENQTLEIAESDVS